MYPEKKIKKVTLKQQKYILDQQYDNAKERQNFNITENSFVFITKEILYLGSWTSYDLNDDHDI